MKITLDAEIASEAKALVALASRNGPSKICIATGRVRRAPATPISRTFLTTRRRA